VERRAFLRLGACAAMAASRTRLFAESNVKSVALRIGKATNVTMSPDFTGLSYESAQLAHPDFFSSGNKALIGMFTRLSHRGVLRLGGNTSEFTRWSAAGTTESGSASAVNPDTGQKEKSASTITPKAIRNLRGFLDATGWHCIYGLNLSHGTPEQAAAEAKFVAETLGDKLIAVQMGNEPDLYFKTWRPKDYNFTAYLDEWNRFAGAIRKAVKNARFAGPDVAENYHWVAQFAAQHSPDTVMLTGHYYAEGPPSDPRMTIEYLLHPTPRLLAEISIATQASRESKMPFRMAEGNCCHWGGKPGVSDTFASSLWAGDYMLQLAQAGYVGMNLHGGGGGVYSPIAGDTINGFTARPVLFGMELANQFASTTFLDTELDTNGANVTAYAAKRDDRWLLAIFNKDSTSVRVGLTGDSSRVIGTPTRTMLLRAPAIDSKQGVTFAEGRAGIESSPDSKIAFEMSPYSGVLLEFGS